MKLNIIQKLLLVATLPIITLLIFSANHYNDKYSLLIANKLELTHLKVMKRSSHLIHALQIERGLSASYLNKTSDKYFLSMLEKRKKKTDEAIKALHSSLKKLNKNKVILSTNEHITDALLVLDSIYDIRYFVLKKEIKAERSFDFYTQLNNQLISVIDGFNIHTNSKTTNLDILTLHEFIKYQEFAGQERALVANFAYSKNITLKDMRLYHKLVSSQIVQNTEIHFLLKNSHLGKLIKDLDQEYENNFFNLARGEITDYEIKKYLINDIYKTIGYGGMLHNLTKYQNTKNIQFYNEYLKKKATFDILIQQYISYSNTFSNEREIAINLSASFNNMGSTQINNLLKMRIFSLYKKLENTTLSLNSKEWFNISTKRINDIHHIEDKLFIKIFTSIEDNIESTYNSLRNQIILTLMTIILLLLGTFYLANKLKYSITHLHNGLDDFFNYLNFKSEKFKNIDTHSNDEISDMAQSINIQIAHIENNFEEDKYFINEITQIVTMMKDGDFSEKPYFKPHNPNLIELKNVFNELIGLITDKIKEQTNSLEIMNSSLEDRVHHQTLELENQIKEITLSRDKAIQAEIAKDEFLANMSHEIRTPLNAILGFVTILKKRVKEDKNLKYLNIINTSGQSLLTIINDILDFSKIQSGKFTISTHNIDTVEEFSNAVLLFASKAYEKHLVYAVYIDPNLPQSIKIDSVRVKQILSNLLSNAIKFTPEDGEIKVKVIFEDERLIISIQDDGIGISEKNQKKVFSAFEQADGSTTRKYGGTGLGLSISSKLTQLMDGELTLKSEEGKGSTFTLCLPVEVIDNSKKEYLDSQKLSSLKIAILDNNVRTSAHGNLIKKYLQDFGFKDILELTQYQEDGYNLLFFVPSDDYNEEIVNAKIPAVAMLRSNTVKLAELEHIEALYAPFVPQSIIESIGYINIQKITSQHIETNEEVLFSGKILVAEDNKTNQMLISLLLSDYGIDFKIANNGLEAVEMFQKEKFDMVLMDENMPELNGIEAMKQMKEYEKTNSLVLTPIIALTASVLESDKEMFMNAGMDGFVGKPISNKELEAEIGKYLIRI